MAIMGHNYPHHGYVTKFKMTFKKKKLKLKIQIDVIQVW